MWDMTELCMTTKPLMATGYYFTGKEHKCTFGLCGIRLSFACWTQRPSYENNSKSQCFESVLVILLKSRNAGNLDLVACALAIDAVSGASRVEDVLFFLELTRTLSTEHHPTLMTSSSASFHVDELLGQGSVLPPRLTDYAPVRRASFLDLLTFFNARFQSHICGDTSDALGHNLMKFSVCLVLPSLNPGSVRLEHLGSDLMAGAHDAWLEGLVGGAWTGHAGDDGLVDFESELGGQSKKMADIDGRCVRSVDGLSGCVDVVCGVVRAGQQKSGPTMSRHTATVRTRGQ